MISEHGSRSTGRDSDHQRKNMLQLYDSEQNALGALSSSVGCGQTSDRLEQSKLLYFNALRIPSTPGLACAERTGTGAVRITGSYAATQHHFYAGVKLPKLLEGIPGTFSLRCMLPIVEKSVTVSDLVDVANEQSFGGSTFAALDKPFVDLLKQDLSAGGQTTGAKVNLDPWKKTGAGDLTLLLDWDAHFRQYRKHLKEVTVSGHTGITIPSGSQTTTEDTFSLPLGSDGAWGIPFGLGIDLGFDAAYIKNIHFGGTAEFYQRIDTSRTARLKTSEKQTDFLFLSGGEVIKEHGLFWQFTLHSQIKDILVKGLSFKAAYQFLKNDTDELVARTNKFSTRIINLSGPLRESVSKNVILSMKYEAESPFFGTALIPQFSFFYKLPIGGKNIVDPYTVGASFNLHF